MRAVLTALGFLIGSCGVAMADEPITQPVWITRPAQGELPPEFPMSDYRIFVGLSCDVERGVPTRCEPLDPTPDAFLEAARRAAGAAQLGPVDGEGQPVEGRRLGVEISFPLIVPDAPPASDASYLTGLTWLERPSARDFYENYPRAALRTGLSGDAILDCEIDGEGWLSCTVLIEQPSDAGFGQASLRLAPKFRVAPQTRDGVATAGGRVRVPIRFRLR